MAATVRGQQRRRGPGLAVPRAAAVPGRTSTAPVADEAPRPAARGARSARRILVVDDNVDVVETTDDAAVARRATRCAAPRTACRRCTWPAEFRPDVVLLDIGLPLMDGYEVARRLRQTPQTAGALLIALTGYGQQGDRQRGRDAGFDGHMLKPVDPHALAKMIERLRRPPASRRRQVGAKRRAREASDGVRADRARRRAARDARFGAMHAIEPRQQRRHAQRLVPDVAEAGAGRHELGLGGDGDRRDLLPARHLAHAFQQLGAVAVGQAQVQQQQRRLAGAAVAAIADAPSTAMTSSSSGRNSNTVCISSTLTG